jgi:hypothetical protein
MADLIFPFGGRSDYSSFEGQAPLTARKAENVRGRDPVTWRIRGSQRAGVSKFNSTALASTKIREMCCLVTDNRKINYAVRNRNLLTESEDVSSWLALGAGVTSLSATEVAPDGSLTVYLMNDNDGAAFYGVYEDHTPLTNGVDYTFSCHLKEDDATVSTITVNHFGGTKSITCNYTWATEDLNVVIAGGATASGRVTPSIRGFVRLEATIEHDSVDSATVRTLIFPDGASAASTNQAYVWGAQFEQASAATAYHPVAPQREWGWPA